MIKSPGAWLPFMLLACCALPAHAQQAWLMTYGTAERVEEQFGHNAIWIRDPARGIDEVYNFGFFDFDKPGFYTEYLFGEMVYFALARAPEEELSYYRWRDRSVRAQRLALEPAQVRRLTDWLEERVQPETRDFRYDYYFNNCSNRVRDALDHVLDGALQDHAESRPARLNFRQHTKRLLQDAPLLYTAIHIGLGRMADRPRTRWEEMFLPGVVAETLAGMDIAGQAGDPKPLVIADRMLFESTRPEPPTLPSPAWPWYLLLGVATSLIIVVPARLSESSRWIGFSGARLWIAFSGLAGLVLVFLWTATAHEAAWRNENLLLLNPLNLLLWRFRGGRAERWAVFAIAASIAAALSIKLFPGAQFNHDLLLWFVPAQASLLWAWTESAHAIREPK
ncbi:MAG: lipoprotein N-acyltransferase Lnb domain-containing protein [Candidatus Wenzhouxiangella sp. M2_3B_020]